MTLKENLTKGFFKESPVFVLLLGMCPTLGVTNSAINGLGMGLATTVVLIASNLVISLVKDLIPDKVRIPSFIVIIATFVTIIDMSMAAYLPSLHENLGLFIPLIVVNCIILGRAEAFASKNNPIASLVDGISMGLGFTMALTMLGIIREILGSGSIFDIPFVAEDASTYLLFVMPPGAFITLGLLIPSINAIRDSLVKNRKDIKEHTIEIPEEA
ncbi:electron transport complex subunit E [Spirochaetia bacterium 38H-sp]|uniref:Ion-translocating oxidoreductase complex subunit E n=1 Tax=Rarispira pelagica TaxID=3141764 RepID=A0ABU9UD78_9SPIR